MAANALKTAVRRLRVQLVADPHGGFSDRQLLERFLHQHDEEAFTALVRRHERLVHTALAKVLTNPADVEDAFQATFLVLVRKAKSVRWEGGFGGWLYAVAHRVAVHARAALRKRALREEEAAGRAETLDAPPDLSWREACALLHEELDRLPNKFRLPLLLCYLEDKSRDEAAAQLGLTPATVKGRLERGRARLRARLTRRGVALSAGLLAALTHSPARAFSPRLVETTLAAATGAVPARVAVLVQGVTTLMTLSKMKFLAGMLLVAGLVGTLLGVLPLAPQAVSSPSVASRVLDQDSKPVASKEDLAKRELEKAQGKWKLIRMESSGTLIFPHRNDSWKLDIKGDRYIFINATDGKELRGGEHTFKYDPTQKPKTVDFFITTLGGTKTPYEGIYELEGDSLKLCYARSRPKELASKEGSGHILMILEREKR